MRFDIRHIGAILVLMLAGTIIMACSYDSPIGTGFEAHVMDLPCEPPAVIYVLRADHAMKACGDTTKAVEGLRTEAMGCTTEMPSEHPFKHVIVTPPSLGVLLHECKHTQGDWH